jgi:hypothetical protein
MMPAKNDSGPLASRVQSSFQNLRGAVTQLNSASDYFSKLIGEADATLKPLNIGIVCWVNLGPKWFDDRGHSGFDQVGYTKINGKWGIALRSVTEYESAADDDDDVWPFAEGPRRLRLKAIDYIPELLDELAKKAVEGAKDITEKATELEGLVSALKGVQDK